MHYHYEFTNWDEEVTNWESWNEVKKTNTSYNTLHLLRRPTRSVIVRNNSSFTMPSLDDAGQIRAAS